MTTTTAPSPAATPAVAPKPKNPFEQLIDGAKDALHNVLAGRRQLLGFSGGVYIEDGKVFIQTSEQIGPASFTQPALELDPLVVLHLAANGVAGTIGKLFGKKA